MLALPLALVAALAVPDLQPTQPVGPVVKPPPLVPYGTASGSWRAGSLLEEGFLIALLVDAAGTPLYVLDGRLSAGGKLSGSLRTLEYATNPALYLPPLLVSGQAEISPEGGGSFWASIFSPLEGAIPIHPYGQIEGLLLPGSLQRQAAGALPSVSVSGQVGVGPVAQLERERSLASGVIVCPHAPLNPISAALASATKVPGEIGAAGRRVPPQGEGQARARWQLFP